MAKGMRGQKISFSTCHLFGVQMHEKRLSCTKRVHSIFITCMDVGIRMLLDSRLDL